MIVTLGLYVVLIIIPFLALKRNVSSLDHTNSLNIKAYFVKVHKEKETNSTNNITNLVWYKHTGKIRERHSHHMYQIPDLLKFPLF